MEVIYITGGSGTGKTTFAKHIAKEKKLTPFVSSGSNDILDGYKGEEVIILDDLRASCIGLSDLLKMLDNNTVSTVRSRYRNKLLTCQLLIITSVLPIDEFYKNVFESEEEPITQLKRRCQTLIDMDVNFIKYYMYDYETRDYKYFTKLPNPVREYLEGKPKTAQEMKDRLKAILGDVVAGIDDIPDNMLGLEEVEEEIKW